MGCAGTISLCRYSWNHFHTWPSFWERFLGHIFSLLDTSFEYVTLWKCMHYHTACLEIWNYHGGQWTHHGWAVEKGLLKNKWKNCTFIACSTFFTHEMWRKRFYLTSSYAYHAYHISFSTMGMQLSNFFFMVKVIRTPCVSNNKQYLCYDTGFLQLGYH